MSIRRIQTICRKRRFRRWAPKHTQGEEVAIYANGPRAYLVRGTLEQNAIYHVMANALGL